MLKRGLRFVADMIMPEVCTVCGMELSSGLHFICADCLSDLPLTRMERLGRNPMADTLNSFIETGHYCYATALFYYREDSPYREITKALKYRGNLGCGRYFSDMLSECLSASPLYRDVDLVVPVPLHWLRKLKRGYNQSDVIAERLASGLGAEFAGDMLIRTRHTRSQTRLSSEEKRRNVRGAFRINRARLKSLGKAPSHILIVDDVFTSGSTTGACALVLREVFGPDIKISAATLAFVQK